jgi:hypothetical protein
MERITVPKVRFRRAQRFQIPAFPLSALAVASVEGNGVLSTGIGLDRDSRLAATKAHCEAIERWLYETWCESGRSPFSQLEEPPRRRHLDQVCIQISNVREELHSWSGESGPSCVGAQRGVIH